MTPKQLFRFFREIFALSVTFLVVFPLFVSADQVTLQWDAAETAVDGYNVYIHAEGQSFDYTDPINETGITETTFTVGGLTAGNTYFFVVRAFWESAESENSNVVEFTVPVPELDSDGDGYNDAIDDFDNDPEEWLDTDQDGIGNNADSDDDADAMPDAWEVLYGLDPLVDDGDSDLDGDGITNFVEYENGSNPSQLPDNTIPEKPVLVSPMNGESGVDLMPTLITDTFVDADQDRHVRTHFQIALSADWDVLDNADLVFDHVSAQYLTSLPLGDLILEPETTYYWRVRFYDAHNGASQWSETAQFSTTDQSSTVYADDDGDGVANDQEIAVEDIDPDLNVDSDVIVIGANDATNPQLGLAFSTHADVLAVRTSTSEAVEVGSNANRPQILTGVLSFKLRLQADAISASMTLYFTAPVPDNAVWYKYNLEEGWVPYPDHDQKVRFSADRKSVTIHMEDGGEEDDDGVQNGVIVDPAGLGYSVTSASEDDTSQISDISTSTGGSGGGCFVDTVFGEETPTGQNGYLLVIIFGLIGLIINLVRKNIKSDS